MVEVGLVGGWYEPTTSATDWELRQADAHSTRKTPDSQFKVKAPDHVAFTSEYCFCSDEPFAMRELGLSTALWISTVNEACAEFRQEGTQDESTDSHRQVKLPSKSAFKAERACCSDELFAMREAGLVITL